MQRQAVKSDLSSPRHLPWRWAFVAALVMTCACAAWVHLGTPGLRWREASTAGTAHIAPPVHVAIVAKRDVPVFLEGLGVVQATNAVTIRSRVDGQITKVAFKEGDIVKQGDVLVQIDDAAYRAALGQAAAKLAQDQASLINAQQDLARTVSLSKAGDATQQLLDQRKAAVAQFTAQIQADDAAIQSAQVLLAYTTIKAPLTGRVGFRLVDAGNIVHANDQAGILTIVQLTPISVVFTAPEDQLPVINNALKAGPLAVTAFSSDGKRTLAEGTLSLIDNAVDAATGTIRLKASFNDDDHALWPGQSVVTRLRVSTTANAIVVPDLAIQRGPNGLFAFVVTKDGKAELRDTKIGQIEDGWAVIESGLEPGDRIVTSGQYRVVPGQAVQVLGEQARASDKPSDAP